MLKSLLIHNPKCSKSLATKELLESHSIQFDTVDYLKDGLKEKLLIHLPKLLNLKFQDFVRKNEEIYKQLDLKNRSLSDHEWINLLIENPILLERPIFIHNDIAVIGRPPERVLDIVSSKN